MHIPHKLALAASLVAVTSLVASSAWAAPTPSTKVTAAIGTTRLFNTFTGSGQPDLDGQFMYKVQGMDGFDAKCATGENPNDPDSNLLSYQDRAPSTLFNAGPSLAVLVTSKCTATDLPSNAQGCTVLDAEKGIFEVFLRARLADFGEPGTEDRHEIFFTCNEVSSGLGDPDNFISDAGKVRNGNIQVQTAA